MDTSDSEHRIVTACVLIIGNALRGDVVMGRANSAGREDVIEGGPHLVNRRHDHAGVVRDHPGVAQPDAEFV